jgi:hypothetical protein
LSATNSTPVDRRSALFDWRLAVEGFTLLFLALCVPTTSAMSLYSHETDDAVTLKVVKLKQLHEAVKKHRGKPVLLYCWGLYSIPDCRMFPKLLAIRDKYNGAISVDSPEQEKLASLLKFLRRHEATIGNFVIDEDAEVWMRELTIAPGVIVYDASGKRVATYNCQDETDFFEAAETHLKKLLEKSRK